LENHKVLGSRWILEVVTIEGQICLFDRRGRRITSTLTVMAWPRRVTDRTTSNERRVYTDRKVAISLEAVSESKIRVNTPVAG
jgi:hypothetical protein